MTRLSFKLISCPKGSFKTILLELVGTLDDLAVVVRVRVRVRVRGKGRVRDGNSCPYDNSRGRTFAGGDQRSWCGKV